jgi:predicted nucleic acid-binding protein
MRRLLADTNVYIDWINERRHQEVLFADRTVKYLSAVVMMELLAGTSSPRDRRLLASLVAAYERAKRILVPTAAVFAEAGEVLRRLRAERGIHLSSSNTIVNDVLIALSARSIGATIATQNEGDYRMIQEVRSFKLQIV